MHSLSQHRLSKVYHYQGHSYAYINPPVLFCSENPTEVLICKKNTGEQLIVIQPTDELKQYKQLCEETLGCSIKQDDQHQAPFFITVSQTKELPALYDQNGLVLPALTAKDIPWSASARVALAAVRAVFGAGGGDGDEKQPISSIKYEVQQLMVVGKMVNNSQCLFQQGKNKDK
jgi:hypothetical protein